MNYFGLFFSFMIPGIILGMLAVGSIREAEQGRAPSAGERAVCPVCWPAEASPVCGRPFPARAVPFPGSLNLGRPLL